MTGITSPDVFLMLNSVFAGVTVFGGMACLGIWRYDRTQRAFLWASLLALTMALSLVCGVIILTQPATETMRTATFLRVTLYSCCALLALRAVEHLLPGLRLRWIVRAMVALLVLRTALWFSTDLILDHHPDSNAWPHYGPLIATAGLFNVGVLAAGAMAFHRTSGKVRLVILACGLSMAVLTTTPALLDTSGLALEEVFTLNVLPGGVAILFLAGSRLLRNARGLDTLVRRQDILLRLSQTAVTEPIDTVRHRVERELRAELRRDVVVAVSGPDRFPQPGTSATTIRVSGRRQRAVARGLGPMPNATRQFVEAALGTLLAASERATSDADHAHAAGHDHLTGLPNLVALSGRLDDRLRADDRLIGGPARLVVVQCRLLGLGQVAAVDGQDRVNSLVREVAGVLGTLRRSRTILARIATDTFCLADQVPPGEGRTFLAARLSEIHTALAAAVPAVAVSMGAAEAATDAAAATLLSDSAVALERAPFGGDAVFDDAVGADVRARVALERDLTSAVVRDEIEVHYQPVAEPGSRAMVAVEALARWRRHGEMTPPDIWIPTAERLGLIHDIGRRVLEIAARDQQHLAVPVAVNVSPLQLAEESFVADVLAAIGDCPPRQVVLEITESAVMADLVRSVAVLQDLRTYGVRIALDDFGSSYSSLSALADLPVDILKLDSSFIARLDQPNGVAIVRAVVALGQSLGKPIVAEGIETEAQLSIIAELGVDRVQGYLLGRPAALDELSGRNYSSSVR